MPERKVRKGTPAKGTSRRKQMPHVEEEHKIVRAVMRQVGGQLRQIEAKMHQRVDEGKEIEESLKNWAKANEEDHKKLKQDMTKHAAVSKALVDKVESVKKDIKQKETEIRAMLVEKAEENQTWARVEKTKVQKVIDDSWRKADEMKAQFQAKKDEFQKRAEEMDIKFQETLNQFQKNTDDLNQELQATIDTKKVELDNTVGAKLTVLKETFDPLLENIGKEKQAQDDNFLKILEQGNELVKRLETLRKVTEKQLQEQKQANADLIKDLETAKETTTKSISEALEPTPEEKEEITEEETKPEKEESQPEAEIPLGVPKAVEIKEVPEKTPEIKEEVKEEKPETKPEAEKKVFTPEGVRTVKSISAWKERKKRYEEEQKEKEQQEGVVRSRIMKEMRLSFIKNSVKVVVGVALVTGVTLIVLNANKVSKKVVNLANKSVKWFNSLNLTIPRKPKVQDTFPEPAQVPVQKPVVEPIRTKEKKETKKPVKKPTKEKKTQPVEKSKQAVAGKYDVYLEIFKKRYKDTKEIEFNKVVRVLEKYKNNPEARVKIMRAIRKRVESLRGIHGKTTEEILRSMKPYHVGTLVGMFEDEGIDVNSIR